VSNDADRGKPLAVLTTAADALARGSDLDAILGAILGAAVGVTGALRAGVLLQDPDRPDLEFAGAVGFDDGMIEAFRAVASDPDHPAVVAARTRAAVFGRPEAGDATVEHADLPFVVSRGGIDRTVGVASFVWPAGTELKDDDRAVLLATADLLATAVDRAHLASTVVERSDWFERMAHTDPLTGLANHRTFARILELEIARASRQGGEVSVALFDVDDFAETNAESGAEVGDDVLRTIASLLAESVRLVDTVARYGGDEFVLVAPGAAGATVARRVLDGIRALPAFDGHRISISAGVARFPADGADATELLAAAEAALVRARDEGRGSLGEASGVAPGA
jgi:diguanylate cyclase (GGDEF)-like protein